MFLRKRLTALVLSVVVVACTLGFLSGLDRRQKPAATLLYPTATSREAGFWPLNHSTLWSISGLDPSSRGQYLTVVARAQHHDLAEHQTPYIPNFQEISKAECESEVGTGWTGPAEEATLTIRAQLVDLRQIGIVDEQKPLRLLLTLSHRGSTMSSGEKSIIEGDWIVGDVCNPEPQWKNGELHLQRFYVQSGRRVTCYDIVVVAAPREALP
jgi:hypothetical protein